MKTVDLSRTAQILDLVHLGVLRSSQPVNRIGVRIDNLRVMHLQKEGHQRLIPAEDVLESPVFHYVLRHQRILLTSSPMIWVPFVTRTPGSAVYSSSSNSLVARMAACNSVLAATWISRTWVTV